MMTMESWSDGFYSLVYSWTFLLCCAYLWTAGYAIALKKRSYIVSSALLCGICFLFLQIVRYTTISERDIYIEDLFLAVSHLQTYFWCVLLTAFSAYAVLMVLNIRKWRKNHITPMSIKDCGDGHPAGIVFWNESGRVLFSNAAADYISILLSKTPVMNGKEFFDALGASPVKLSDGSVWSFNHRISIFEKEMLHELVLFDNTEIYRKTEELEEDTKRLRKMNAELRKYNRQIEELVRNREILNAKVRIHDEMNQLLSATGRAFEEADEEKQRKLLKAWEDSTFLLSHEENNEQNENILKDLSTYGELLGIEFICPAVPDIKDQEKMHFFVIAAREAMNNAVKHGGARHLYTSFEEKDDSWICVFTDDGKAKMTKLAVPAGGLRNLEKEAKRLGGKLQIKNGTPFKVVITIPKGETQA